MIPTICAALFAKNEGCSLASIQQAEQRLGQALPLVLRVFYEEFGAHPLNQAHNRLVMPELLTADESGFVCFYEENQGVILWAVSIASFGEEDPVVYESYDNGATWTLHDDHELLSEFLTDATLFQGIMGGFPFTAGHTGLSKAPEETILGQFPPFAAAPNRRGMRYYGTANQLIAVMEGDVANDLWIACREKTSFVELQRALKISWDYNSMEED